MASVKKESKKLYHEELLENKIIAAKEEELLPEYAIEEEKEEIPLVAEKDRAERFVEWPVVKHIDKCKLRCCKEFDVTLQHMSGVVRDLNGRKVDGVFVNDLIGRYGFYNGVQMNRPDLAAKYKRSQSEIEFAHDKLKAIVQHEDYKEAYLKYMEGIKKEEDKKIKDHIETGEEI